MRIICNEQRKLEIDNEYGKSTDSKMERKNDEQTKTCLTIYLFRYIAIAHYLISSSISQTNKYQLKTIGHIDLISLPLSFQVFQFYNLNFVWLGL